MSETFWRKNGKLICDSNGKLIKCENCPCQVTPSGCPSGTVAYMTISFTQTGACFSQLPSISTPNPGQIWLTSSATSDAWSICSVDNYYKGQSVGGISYDYAHCASCVTLDSNIILHKNSQSFPYLDIETDGICRPFVNGVITGTTMGYFSQDADKCVTLDINYQIHGLPKCQEAPAGCPSGTTCYITIDNLHKTQDCTFVPGGVTPPADPGQLWVRCVPEEYSCDYCGIKSKVFDFGVISMWWDSDGYWYITQIGFQEDSANKSIACNGGDYKDGDTIQGVYWQNDLGACCYWEGTLHIHNAPPSPQAVSISNAEFQ